VASGKEKEKKGGGRSHYVEELSRSPQKEVVEKIPEDGFLRGEGDETLNFEEKKSFIGEGP